MFKKYNRYILLKVFLDFPLDSFRLRELGRISKISPASVLNYLKEFVDEGLIKKYEKRGVPFYLAERDNSNFIFYKKLSILYEINKSGLVEFLWDKLAPEAIVLYGSYVKGEAIEESDLDIFIIGKEKKISLDKFAGILNKEIHLIFRDNLKKMPKQFKTNLINGIVLKGYLNL